MFLFARVTFIVVSCIALKMRYLKMTLKLATGGGFPFFEIFLQFLYTNNILKNVCLAACTLHPYFC